MAIDSVMEAEATTSSTLSISENSTTTTETTLITTPIVFENSTTTTETTLITTPIVFSPTSPRPWVPTCSPRLRLRVGMHFNTLEEGVKFYQSYASECGFSTRLYNSKKGKDGKISCRHVVCSREGYKEDSLKKEEKLRKKAAKVLYPGKTAEMCVNIGENSKSTRVIAFGIPPD